MSELEKLVGAIFGERKANQLRYVKYIAEANVLPEDRCLALFALEHADLSLNEVASEAGHAAGEHDNIACARFALATIEFNKYMSDIQLSVYLRCASCPKDQLEAGRIEAEKLYAEQKQRFTEILLKLENKQAIVDGTRH